MSLDPFVGEIKIFGFNYAPQGYLLCQGQLIPISQNTVLFALIGTNFGGDGVQTFALPDLQGRVPVGQGQVAGLPSYSIGEKGGNVAITLSVSNMPQHTHPATGIVVNLPVSTGAGDTTSASGAFLANTGSEVFSSVNTPNQNYGSLSVSGTTGLAGSSIPINVMNPYLVLNYSIATEGIFPSRS